MAASEPGQRSVRAFVVGRVQGVAFRWYTQERARALGLVGWVRNLEDGRVEARVQGESEAVEAMLDFLAQGPPHAQVSSRSVFEESVEEFEAFSIE